MRKVIVAVALMVLSAAATAADNGIYLGGAVGKANLEIDDIFGVEDFKGDDTGYKLIVGIRPLDWLAVEASYVNFGEPDDTVMGIPLAAESDGISAFAVGFLAAGPVDVFGKLGLISWDSRVTDDATDLAYGVGAQFRVWGISLRAEYERFDVDDVDDLSMISVGVTYTFL
jgi:Outer membrane protein beta-barrel domain